MNDWILREQHRCFIFKNRISLFKQKMFLVSADTSAVLAEDMLFTLFIFDVPYGCNGPDDLLKFLFSVTFASDLRPSLQVSRV